MSKVKPFSSGSQFDDWEDSNCHKCEYYKLGNCDIANALIISYWGDGTVSQEIANRMGYVKDKYVWQYTEVNWIEKELIPQVYMSDVLNGSYIEEMLNETKGG